jgi:glutaredoxin-like protein NrdH
MKTTVYSLPDCVQCTATKLYLKKRGVEYDEVNLTQDNDAWELATKTLGYKSAPVVVVRDGDDNIVGHWNGFSPEKIEKLLSKNSDES